MQISISILVANATSGISYVKRLVKNFKARVLSYPNSIFEAEPCLVATLTELNNIELLRQSSLVITPNAYNEGVLYDVIPNTPLGDMDVVRATTATRVNSAGLIEVVPRNLLTYSEQFDNAAWTKNNLNVTANATIAPNGTMTAEKIVGTAINATHIALQQVPFSVNTVATCTIYAKAAELNFLYVGGLGRSPSANEGYVFFNLSNGTVGANDAGYTGSISNEGNGWYRLTVNAPSMPTSTLREFRIGVTNTNGMQSYLGDGTSGVFVWGAQLEQGSTATEYFPTTTRLNIPRIDYTNGSCPSLLVEPQRTNLLLQSNVFNSTSWSKYGTPVINSGILSPDGTNNAFELNMSVAQGIYQNATNTAGTYTCSIYIKGDTNGIIGLIDGNSLPTQTVNVTTEWKRVNVVLTKGSSPLQYAIYRLNLSHLSKVYIYGAQCELGAYPTSYIPTVASTVTRNADVISKTGISSLIGQTEGTIFIHLKNNSIDATTKIILKLWDGTENNRIQLSTFADVFFFFIATGGTTQINLNYAPPILTNNKYKVAIKYASNSFKVFINGANVITNTSLSVPSTSALVFGNNGLSGLFNSINIDSTQLYKTALTDAECIALTTI